MLLDDLLPISWPIKIDWLKNVFIGTRMNSTLLTFRSSREQVIGKGTGENRGVNVRREEDVVVARRNLLSSPPSSLI